MQHLETIFRTLNDANMKAQLDKCEFFKEEVEFLGFVISKDGIKSNPKKVEAIAKFPLPRKLKELKSFLGMAGYYRRFVKDFAVIAKPLTKFLRGEDGRVPKNMSAKKIINFDEDAIEAFENIKKSLISEDIILHYPEYMLSVKY